jgi:putative ABC transport system permease protein
MINLPLTKKLVRDLWHRGGMISTLVLVLAVGVSTYVGMAGVYQNLNDAKAQYYAKYNLADFTIDLKRAPVTAAESLGHIPNVFHLRTRIKTATVVNLPAKSYAGIQRPIPGVALSLPVPRRDVIDNVMLYSGRWFSSPYAREIIVDQQFAHARHLTLGDKIKIRLPDKEHNLLIVGTVYSPEHVMMLPPGGALAPDPAGYAVIYMPRKFLQERSNLRSSFNQLLGLVQDDSKTAIQNTMTLLSDKLDPYGVALQTPRTEEPSVMVLHDELTNIQSLTTIFPTLFLLVAALVLNVMMGRLVAQQRGAIGTLKAIGYSNAAIIRHYLCYGLIVGVLGGIVGIGCGLWLQNVLLNTYKTYFIIPGIKFFIYKKALVIGIIISIISSLLGTVMGTYHAMKLEPAEAMRPPAPEKTHHILVERFTKFWHDLSFINKMVMRAIFRNRFRSIVTILATVLATSLVYSSLEFFDSINKMVEFSFVKTQHQTFTLTLREPLGLNIMRSLDILPGVKKTETQLNVPAKLQHGPFIKRMQIQGLPLNNKLSTPVNKKGEPIQISKTGIVLNKTVAKILHAKIGDSILVRPLIGNRQTVHAKVQNIVTTYLGLSAYANQTWLSNLIGDSWVANTVLFKLLPGLNYANFILRTNKISSMINLSELSVGKQLFITTMNQFMTFFVVLMVIFAGVIAMGSIINTAMISLNERERDVACLRVLGFTNLQVAKIFFGESAILNTVGILLGLLGGIYFAYYMSTAFSTDMYRMPVVITMRRLLEAAAVMIIFVVLSQAIIYRVIKKLNWFDILNNRE